MMCRLFAFRLKRRIGFGELIKSMASRMNDVLELKTIYNGLFDHSQHNRYTRRGNQELIALVNTIYEKTKKKKDKI